MSQDTADVEQPPKIIQSLQDVLQDLAAHPFPLVESPPAVKKRASVALIIRVNPRYSHWPKTSNGFNETQVGSDSVSDRLTDFFTQEWVRWGDPEALFIKRSARQADRWQGHVALPGGRRDPEDADDRATAARETAEEVGIDLSDRNAISVGNLPQRLVTTSWGKVPLMVLCPYVFLVTHYDIPQKLQPTEIASTHWVPLRALINPALRTYEYQDVSSRLAKQEFGIKRWFMRLMLGQMMFSAIRLIPTETIQCSSVSGFLPNDSKGTTSITSKVAMALGISSNTDARAGEPPLLLWGLTLGVFADFLDLLPPHNALELWTYPTFSPLDVRLILWIMSYRFRRQKHLEIQSGKLHPPASVELGLDALPSANDQQKPEGGISGLSVGSRALLRSRGQSTFSSSAVATMLEGYYEIVRSGVAVALITRTSALLVVLLAIWHRRKKG